MTRSNIHPHLAVEKLWKNSVVEPQSPAGLSRRAVRRLYDARPSMKSPERGTSGKNLGKSANFSAPSQTSVSVSPFVRRRRMWDALN